VVADVFIDGSVERLKCGNQKNDYSSGRENAGHSFQCCNVVFDVFQNVHDY